MKSAYSIFIAFIWTFILVGCGGGGSISTDPDGGGTPDPTTISITLSADKTLISAESKAIITAKVTDSSGAPVSALVSFSLNNVNYGTFTPGTGEVATNSDGVAEITLDTASINTGATVTAAVPSGESAFINVTMVGDGGDAGSGAQVSLSLTDNEGNSIESITTLSPGRLTAEVTGISKPTIVTFDSPLGDLPIKTAVTDANGLASVSIFAGSELGAAEATATLPTNEIGKTIVVLGATNVLMGSGDPFKENIASVEHAGEKLSAGGTATISVLIQDDKGNPFSQPIDVYFSSTCGTKTPAQAIISSPISSSNGKATTTYLAQGCVGEDQINVSANAGGISLSASATLEVSQADVGSIAFVSAMPENIGILGTGGTESSVVKFRVLDENSNPVTNQNVLFELNTVTGGVELNPSAATTNSDGIVQTVVTTGTVATSVRVTATVDNSAVPAITSQSKLLVISTGIPDQDSFSLAAEFVNAEGWNRDGTEVEVTARMADAFNNPVPDGTTISFTTEGGSIEDACQTTNGACSVTWTSQLSRPEGATLFNEQGIQINNPTAIQKCFVLKKSVTDSDVCDLNNSNQVRVYGNYYGQPFGGRATITATAIGEETFPDLNGNGRFDYVPGDYEDEKDAFLNGTDVTGEPFDLNDAFNDYNEDTVFNPQPDEQLIGLVGGELEELIDFDSQGDFDTKDKKYNGVLCASPAHDYCADGISDSKSVYVRRSLTMVMSGSAAVATKHEDIVIVDQELVDDVDDKGEPITVIARREHKGGSIQIYGKGSATVHFTISDLHNQQMPAGSIVSFSTSAGSISSTNPIIWPSSNYNGGRQFSVSLKGVDEPTSGVFSVVVETPNKVTTEVVTIDVNIL
ncbi:hypothetical protein TUM4438_18430 [Shewanella sairae]|uniref:Big-1 domain-containing protein n=1 Tax=Shewanella sairae TaxID=190310 RepID=A0ABQ4PCK8_9GAMM|nr:hypothetical protein [Shewanella sairae]MCL1130910.1 hypothetical protein [Shewanella sairae]GIU45288.1 hypothetical protein TUM4438_18430 [Shewanella sairae]